MKSRPRTEFAFRTHGGAREGAGRKPKGPEAGMSHKTRPEFPGRYPVHITMNMMPHVWNLRSRRSFHVVGKAIKVAAERLGTRICEFVIMGNHLHFVVESEGKAQLAAAMKGLAVRIARGLNTMMDRRGKVIADRYDAHILRTPTETRNAVHYVRHNFRKHVPDTPEGYVDEYSSARYRAAAARTWLLQNAVQPGARAAPAPD